MTQVTEDVLTRTSKKVATLIRLLLSDKEGEVDAAAHAIKRTLQAAGTDIINTVAERIEKSNGSALNEAEMKKLYDAGYAAGVQAAESRHRGIDDFSNTDVKPNWDAVAIFLKRNKTRFDAKHHEFVDDMASSTVWGREPTEKQHEYLHSLFFKLGGKIT